MNCENCGTEMAQYEADPDGMPSYCTVTWSGQPDWITAQIVGEHYVCPNDCEGVDRLVEEEEHVAATVALMRRAARLAQPPDGSWYMLTTEKKGDAWIVDVSTLHPIATEPVAEVLEEMLAAGLELAHKRGLRKTPETRLLENLQRLMRLRELNAPGVILKSQRDLVLKFLAAFDPAFMPPESE